MKLDFLVVGAHPDDAELGAGGFLHKMKQRGYRTGIVDLTRGEMGSHGTPEQRLAEAEKSAAILGLDIRLNLDLGDGHLVPNIPKRHELARAIRRVRPTFILAPYINDKHPDHAAAGKMAKGAFYDARIAKLDLGLPPYSVSKLFYYPCHLYHGPSFVVDISDSFCAKMEAMLAYESQFDPQAEAPYEQYIHLGISDYRFHIESRCRHFGSLINVCYGEGFICEDVLALDDPHILLSKEEACCCHLPPSAQE